MTANMFDPGPGNRDGPFAISQTDHQQLMTKTNFRAIHNQTDLSQALPLGLQPFPRNRRIPFPYSDRRIVQETTQPSGNAYRFGWAGDLAGNLAQMHRATLVNPDHQPDEVTHLRDPLTRSQFTNSAHPGIIERVGRHGISPCIK
jgi:hypothetical protein